MDKNNIQLSADFCSGKRDNVAVIVLPARFSGSRFFGVEHGVGAEDGFKTGVVAESVCPVHA
ncbi:hypothetical protein [Bifidobacterium thermophilum]|uniref:hypothetical protein n=1 Tax=Bifidobacterium thermophilum TaxID=33905 RepID=UPI0030A5B58F